MNEAVLLVLLVDHPSIGTYEPERKIERRYIYIFLIYFLTKVQKTMAYDLDEIMRHQVSRAKKAKGVLRRSRASGDHWVLCKLPTNPYRAPDSRSLPVFHPGPY